MSFVSFLFPKDNNCNSKITRRSVLLYLSSTLLNSRAFLESAVVFNPDVLTSGAVVMVVKGNNCNSNITRHSVLQYLSSTLLNSIVFIENAIVTDQRCVLATFVGILMFDP